MTTISSIPKLMTEQEMITVKLTVRFTHYPIMIASDRHLLDFATLLKEITRSTPTDLSKKILT